MAEGLDYGGKAVWKGLTAAHKYAWIRLLNLATGEDPEADRSADEVSEGGYEKPKQEQSMLMKALDAARASKAETAKWVKKKGVEYELNTTDMEQLRISRYSEVAAQARYGKSDDGNRLDCLHDYRDGKGIETQTLYAVDVLPFIKYATEEWPGLGVKGF